MSKLIVNQSSSYLEIMNVGKQFLSAFDFLDIISSASAIKLALSL